MSTTLGHLEEVADCVLGMGQHMYVEAPNVLVELIKALKAERCVHRNYPALVGSFPSRPCGDVQRYSSSPSRGPFV